MFRLNLIPMKNIKTQDGKRKNVFIDFDICYRNFLNMSDSSNDSIYYQL